MTMRILRPRPPAAPVLLLTAGLCAAALAACPPVASVAMAASTHGPDPRREVIPELAGFSSVRLARVDSAIETAIRDGAAPGMALAVARQGRIVRLRGYGRIDWGPFAAPVTDSTLYDIASLTKAVGTATAALLLIHDGRLSPDRPIWHYLEYWPSTGAHGRITARHLLMHTSGLPAGLNLWAGIGTRAERIGRIASARLTNEPGTRRVYSDVGMILMAAIVEQITGERLDWFLEQRVFTPLAMHDTRFNPLRGEHSPFELARIAPTELDGAVRHRHVHGEVHDLNAAALGGVAGHAGMFSSARDLAGFAQMLLDATGGDPTPVAVGNGANTLLVRDGATARPLGWDVATGSNSAAGRYFSTSAFGHTGFTGTSIWIDPQRGLYVVLLTNRLNPTARNQKHLALRRDVHDLVHLALLDPPGRRTD
jgi:CubicO group peptidase (beta-lactamase class C family)